jgi:hypothetical protein
VTRAGARPGPIVALAAAAAACAVIAPPVTKLPDGGYRIACDDTLSSCLGAFETICEWHGYDVISATERRRHADLRDVPGVTITSEAEVRCKPGETLFGRSPEAPAPAPAPAALAPAAPPTPPPPPPPPTPPPPPPTVEPSPPPGPAGSCGISGADGGGTSCGAR